jgi:hypothetical protein
VYTTAAARMTRRPTAAMSWKHRAEIRLQIKCWVSANTDIWEEATKQWREAASQQERSISKAELAAASRNSMD